MDTTLQRHPTMRPALMSALLTLSMLPGCAATATPGASAALLPMARPLGTLQCQPGGPTPDALAAALRDAGVPVAQVACGHDGRMRPAVCGAPDGRLAIVDIPAEHRAKAEALGWRPLASMPDASRQPC